MNPKEFYRTYLADNTTGPLNDHLATLILSEDPNHVFEFGCGTGKNLRMVNAPRIGLSGMDVSLINITYATVYSPGIMFAIGDESYLRNLCNFDVVFTCSVLDHIERVDGIISEFKRICNKVVYLAETVESPGPHYFPHDYESFGFKKVGFTWVSEKPHGDGATYYIWQWRKDWEGQDKRREENDDLG